MAEKRIQIDQLQIKGGTTATLTGYVLKNREPGYDMELGVLKIGDGATKWEDLPAIGANTTEHFEGEAQIIDNESDPVVYETDQEVIARVMDEESPLPDDIFVVKRIIATDAEGVVKKSYTAYVFDGEKWVAMDGNYNAKNVYLANDLIITEDIGVQKIEEGSSFKVLETSGKNVEQIFNMIFNSRKLPTYKEPDIIITCEEAGKYEVGTILSPSYKVELYKGEYEFDPKENTGVEITNVTATFNGVEINAVEGYFDDIVVADEDEHVILIDVEYSDGVAPKDNYGVEITDADELRLC